MADFLNIFNSAPDGLLLVQAEQNRQRFRFVEANLAVLAATGLQRQQLVGQTPEDILPPHQALFLSNHYRDALQSAEVRELVLPFDGPWGRRTWHVRIGPLDGSPDQLICVARDITGSRELSHQLDAMSDYLPGFVYQLTYHPATQEWKYTYVGRRVESMFGVKADSVLADASVLLDMIHPDDRDRVMETSFSTAASLQPWHLEFRLCTADGRTIWLRCHDLPQKNADGLIIWTGYAEDVTEFKALQDEIRSLAETDALTGLPNRSTLMTRMTALIQQSRATGNHFAVLFVDLDEFKPVNDRYGHAVGDEVLRHVALRLKEGVRASDMVARLGGDEFVVLLQKAGSGAQCCEISDKLIREISRPITVGNIATHVSASVGVALYPEHGRSAEVLLKAADRAMYQAKAAGRHQTFLATLRESLSVVTTG